MNSTLTRFRIQTAAPLEPFKAWHVISPDLGIIYIRELTDNITEALGLTEVDGEIILELDGFALLPSSPAGVVRDGDIVTVRCKPRSDKRKATEAVDQPKKKQKTQSPAVAPPLALPPAPTAAKQPSKFPTLSDAGSSRPAPPTKPAEERSKPVPSSSEDDTSSSDSDSSSEDDSDSESSSSSESTSSDSESDSDSDSDTGPTPQPIVRQPPPPVRQTPVSQASATPQPPVRSTPSQPPVPPGQGKQSTKSRNARRRELRKHQAAGTALSSKGTPTPTPAPTAPTPAPFVESVITTQVKASTPIAPAKNANKNKRKGFDKDMAEAVATRITYRTPTPGAAPVVPTPRVDSPVPNAQTKSRYTHYHVVPPSQLKNLPSNVVVTSVDVEAVDGLDGVGEWFDGENRVSEEEMAVENDTSRPPANDNKKVDWEAVDSQWEQSWDSFPAVGEASWSNLRAGALLGYKSLTIDPATCTPCTKIHLARVVSGPSAETGEAECLFIERPGAGDIGFGFGGKFGAAPEAEDDPLDEDVGETRNVGLGEAGGWKIIA